MTWLIALLAYACFAAFGLLVSLWLSWRIEQRTERRRVNRTVPPDGPVHPDVPLPRRGDFRW